MAEKLQSAIYPATAWRVAVGGAGNAGQVALLELAYAKGLADMRAAAAGAPPKNKLPLGLTARQCRDLAADLVDAANKIDRGGKALI
jgi:hypothetical protein